MAEWWLKVTEWWLGPTTADQCGHIPVAMAALIKEVNQL